MAEIDLIIRNTRMVLPDQFVEGDLAVHDGRIASLGTVDHTAKETVEGDGLLLLPGMVDVHVHFMDPTETEREDFPTGSAAAAAAGITTVVEHTHSNPIRDVTAFREKRDYVSKRSVIDFGLAAHFAPGDPDESLAVLREGAAFIKVFTCLTHGIEAIGTGQFYEFMKKIDRRKGLFLVHAEDDALTAVAGQQLKKAGRDDGGVIPEWRHPLAERVAVDTIGELALETDAKVIVAHCSHPMILDTVAYFRKRGAHMYAETCPQYLHLMRDEIKKHQAFRKFTPPARAESEHDLQTMWSRLREGRVAYLATDHAPATAEQKRAGSIWDVPFGLPGVDTTLPLMMDAVNRGKLTWHQLVSLYATNPAQHYGFYPQKGCLYPGSDADFILVAPDNEFAINDNAILSKAGWSPYSGRTVKGKVIATYQRGIKIAENRKCLAEPGTGRFLPGMGTARK